MTPERYHPYPTDSNPFSVAPLESFEFDYDGMRFNSTPFVGEQSLLNFVIPQLSNSLESLRLPLDSAPLAKLASSYWPRLQKLYLWGDRHAGQDQHVPMIAVFSAMPNLRSLTFLSTQKSETRRELIWPEGAPWTYSCAHLEHLQISFPDPNDRIFSHLPPSLRKLSLRCWPRHYLHHHAHERKVMDQNGWRSPIPTSSEMLRVLKRRPSRCLTELEIEYIEDDGDEQLLRAISALFPNLEALTLVRYRRRGETHVPVDRMAQDLSTAARLRILRVHLDFSSDFHPYAAFMRRASAEDLTTFAKVRHDAAELFANHLPSSLQCVCVLTRIRCLNTWRPFLVVRDGSGRVRIETNTSVRTFEGLS
ncbi:hypothetical protein FKP32DRAFT_1580076 [Trametes sanguinea]|nr:hypothetical protein FKP32DRAFT_1580076 [Trametes sanguinea]